MGSIPVGATTLIINSLRIKNPFIERGFLILGQQKDNFLLKD